jgi:hypothetical protein
LIRGNGVSDFHDDHDDIRLSVKVILKIFYSMKLPKFNRLKWRDFLLEYWRFFQDFRFSQR